MKRKSVTFFDVLEKYGGNVVISFVSYLWGVGTVAMFLDVNLGVREWVFIILSFVIVVAFFVWVAKRDGLRYCTVCSEEFLPPSEYKSGGLCQNCLLEKTKDL